MKLKNSFLLKLAFLALAYFIHGPIFEGPVDYVFALLVTFALMFGSLRDGIKPKFILVGGLLLVAGLFTPQLSIPQQQGVLITPAHVPISPQTFFAQEGNYRYAPSANGYLQGLKDSRLVGTIKHDGGVVTLRNAYNNHAKYNYYIPWSPIERAEMPFVVKYIVTPEMVGMTLFAEGFVHFTGAREKVSDLSFKKAHYTFDDSHVGHSIYGFGGKWDGTKMHPLKMALQKTDLYDFYEGFYIFSLFLGMGLLFFSLFAFRPSYNMKIEMLFFGGVTLGLAFFHSTLFKWGILAAGGNDGIVHGGYPYQMLESLIQGDWVAMLMSPEQVFYFMPGMRYVRLIEMLIFGDAYILQVCTLVTVPVVLYRFYSYFLSSYPSIFMVLLSVNLYIKSMTKQFGEWFSYMMLFSGLTLMLGKFTKIRWGFVAFMMMSVAIAIRPNLGIFVIIVGTVHLFTQLFSPLPFWSRFTMLFGLAPALLVPFHNIMGGQFVLATTAASIPENLVLPPSIYLGAIQYFLGFSDQFVGAENFSKYAQLMPRLFLPALLFCLWVSVKGRTPVVKTIAFATFASLAVHLFYFATYRYTFPYMHIALMLLLYQIQQIRYKSFTFSLRSTQPC